jgi:hypothetical protein
LQDKTSDWCLNCLTGLGCGYWTLPVHISGPWQLGAWSGFPPRWQVPRVCQWWQDSACVGFAQQALHENTWGSFALLHRRWYVVISVDMTGGLVWYPHYIIVIWTIEFCNFNVYALFFLIIILIKVCLLKLHLHQCSRLVLCLLMELVVQILYSIVFKTITPMNQQRWKVNQLWS